MSFNVLKQIGDAQKKKAVVDVRSGDTVKVTQKIKEGSKFRLQTFEGVVIRVDRKESHTARIVVRKVTSGVGVEKSYLIHSPLVEKIEIVRNKRFVISPMSAQEACLQMDMLGHGFFVFEEEESGEICVVYRRTDGAYGLIETAR